MTLSALAFTYVFGGFTFVPILLAAILIPAWLLLPQAQDGVGSKPDGGEKERGSDDKSGQDAAVVPEDIRAADEGACVTFAVLRSYDFQAAQAALNARNNSANSAGGAGLTDGAMESGNSSESVYQSMYRTVFDRNKNSPSNNSVLESEDASSSPDGKAKKRVTPVNIFYIVLRHGHLMLYDSAAQMEVRHVISLAHHTVSLSEGTSLDEEHQKLKDADLFIKRTAIVLTPTDMPSGASQPQATAMRPFYLFTLSCSEKEDFYHALLYTRAYPPVPEPLDTNDTIKLQSTLHSTSLTPETRAFNALLGRLFLALYHTDYWKTLVRNKVEKKISRVQKPTFIAALDVQEIDLGDAAPVLSNPRLRDLNISGDMTIAFDLRYNGNVKLTISALAKLDLGTRFKTRTVDLVLATSLQRLHGHMLVRIKPPPSNRIWFCFESIPDMDIRVEPVVSQRQITYSFILRAIEERIRSVVGETLVKPNWDDVAFFDTRQQEVRGGIWKDEGGEPPALPPRELLSRNEKTMSIPVLASGLDPDSSATSSGSETTSKVASGTTASIAAEEMQADLKRRSVASLPATADHSDPVSRDDRPASAGSRAKPLRSPSLTSPSTSAASVALDESLANFDLARTGDAPVQPQQARRWRMRPTPQQQYTRKDAAETMREMRDRSLTGRETDEESKDESDTVKGTQSDNVPDMENGMQEERNISDSPTSASASFTSRSMRSPKRTDSNLSTASTSTTRTQQQRKTILGATAAATIAARNWSWNAVQNRTKGRGGPGQGQQGPLGRGQPLPPPGMPLPGPQKGIFGPGGLVGMGGVKRKPVLPRRKPTSENQAQASKKSEEGQSAGEVSEGGDEEETPTGDEFGPWRENSGVEDFGQGSENELQRERAFDDDTDTVGLGNDSTENLPERQAQPEKKVPPPLPARRKPVPVRPQYTNNALVNEEPISQIAQPEESEPDKAAADMDTAYTSTPEAFRSQNYNDTWSESTDARAEVQHVQSSTETETEPNFMTGEDGRPEDSEYTYEPREGTKNISEHDDILAIPAPEDDEGEVEVGNDDEESPMPSESHDGVEAVNDGGERQPEHIHESDERVPEDTVEPTYTGTASEEERH